MSYDPIPTNPLTVSGTLSGNTASPSGTASVPPTIGSQSGGLNWSVSGTSLVVGKAGTYDVLATLTTSNNNGGGTLTPGIAQAGSATANASRSNTVAPAGAATACTAFGRFTCQVGDTLTISSTLSANGPDALGGTFDVTFVPTQVYPD